MMTFIGPEKFFLPSCTSRGQTFSRIYLTSVAVAGPLCSACHAAACVTQQAGTDFSRWIGSEAERERRFCFEGTSDSSSADRERFIPSFRTNAKCREGQANGRNRVCGQYIANAMQKTNGHPAPSLLSVPSSLSTMNVEKSLG